jgi:branched-chain amino acid transport system permease protein
MSFQSFAQITINGIVLSSMYILVAMGLSVIFSMLRIVTFAHGEMYMLGAYFTWLFSMYMGVHYILSLVLAIVVMFLIGMVLERTLWHPMINDHMRCLVMSLGLCLVLQGIAAAIFGAREKGMRSIFPGVLRVYGISFSNERLAVVIGSLILVLGMLLFFKKTKMGMAMRAVALDPEVSALQGIPVNRIQRIGFGMGCALAAAAGGQIGAIFSIIPTMGLVPILKAFVVVILGGLGSIPGVIAGGFIVGMLDSFSITLVGSVGNMFSFLLFLLVLIIRPQGLMGYEA